MKERTFCFVAIGLLVFSIGILTWSTPAGIVSLVLTYINASYFHKNIDYELGEKEQ